MVSTADAMAPTTVAPGDTVLHLPEDGVIRVGHGVIRVGQELRSTMPGLLVNGSVQRSRAAEGQQGTHSVHSSSRRYTPVPGDLVIGYVTGAFAEEYRVDVRAATAAVLPTLAFEGATKRNRPKLQPGDVVYARVAATSLDMDPELACTDAVGQAAGMGPLEKGFVFESDGGHARRLLAPRVPPELVKLGQSVAFEMAVGANGRVWVHSQAPRVTAAVVRALCESARAGSEDAEATVRRVLAESERD